MQKQRERKNLNACVIDSLVAPVKKISGCVMHACINLACYAIDHDDDDCQKREAVVWLTRSFIVFCSVHYFPSLV